MFACLCFIVTLSSCFVVDHFLSSFRLRFPTISPEVADGRSLPSPAGGFSHQRSPWSDDHRGTCIDFFEHLASLKLPHLKPLTVMERTNHCPLCYGQGLLRSIPRFSFRLSFCSTSFGIVESVSPLCLSGDLRASQYYSSPDESLMSLPVWIYRILLTYGGAVTGIFTSKLLSKLSRRSSIIITAVLHVCFWVTVLIFLHESGPLASIYSLSHSDFEKSSFASNCLWPRASFPCSHVALQTSTLVVVSHTLRFFWRMRWDHLLRLIMSSVNYHFVDSDEVPQNPNLLTNFQLGFYGPHNSPPCWTWVLEVDLSGMAFIIITHTCLVCVIHWVLMAHNVSISLTFLPTNHPLVRECPNLLSLIARVINPECWLSVQRFISSFESSRPFQAAQRRATNIDSPSMPLIFDSLKCLAHLSHRELCCLFVDTHTFSSLLEALSCISLNYVSFAYVSCCLISSLYPNYIG